MSKIEFNSFFILMLLYSSRKICDRIIKKLLSGGLSSEIYLLIKDEALRKSVLRNCITDEGDRCIEIVFDSANKVMWECLLHDA